MRNKTRFCVSMDLIFSLKSTLTTSSGPAAISRLCNCGFRIKAPQLSFVFPTSWLLKIKHRLPTMPFNWPQIQWTQIHGHILRCKRFCLHWLTLQRWTRYFAKCISENGVMRDQSTNIGECSICIDDTIGTVCIASLS